MRRHDLFIDALSSVAEPRRAWPSRRGSRPSLGSSLGPSRGPAARPRHWLVPLTFLVAGTILVAAT